MIGSSWLLQVEPVTGDKGTKNWVGLSWVSASKLLINTAVPV